ncbi:UNVERIFIED_CONTAM: hypothetical protein K2H54_033935 [Gekko kuhli]
MPAMPFVLLLLLRVAAPRGWGQPVSFHADVNSYSLHLPYFNLAEGTRISATATCGEEDAGTKIPRPMEDLFCKLVMQTWLPTAHSKKLSLPSQAEQQQHWAEGHGDGRPLAHDTSSFATFAPAWLWGLQQKPQEPQEQCTQELWGLVKEGSQGGARAGVPGGMGGWWPGLTYQHPQEEEEAAPLGHGHLGAGRACILSKAEILA